MSAASAPATLVLATPASTTRAAGMNLNPTSAAINHWKGIVLKPANLPPFWRGYLNGANLDTCKMKRSAESRTTTATSSTAVRCSPS
jgi:hypothetical protein